VMGNLSAVDRVLSRVPSSPANGAVQVRAVRLRVLCAH
jgi:hypothetical protein